MALVKFVAACGFEQKESTLDVKISIIRKIRCLKSKTFESLVVYYIGGIMLIVRKAKKKIVRPDGMREAWVYQSVTLPPITFKEIVKECADACGEPTNKTLGVVTAMVIRIAACLELGRQVQIDGIGTLKPVINSGSAASAEELGAPTEAIKGVKLRFYPHGPLQEAIAENGYEYQPELDDE